MQLTSGAFAWLTIMIACGFIVGTAWFWPRLADQRPALIGSRLGLIAGSQVLVLVAVLVLLNNVLGFFSSWSSLFGTPATQQAWDPPSTAAFAAGPQPITVTAGSVGIVFRGGLPLRLDGGRLPAGTTPAALRLPGTGGGARPAAQVGAVLQVTIRGEYTGISAVNDYVYLPPQYFQPGYASARFPVVLAFTGYPNYPFNLMRLLELTSFAAKLSAAGRIGPAIYLMVNPSVALPRDTECTNVPAGPQVATFFGTDVPLAVQRTFAAQTSASGWGTIGYSTGAVCAAKVAMLFPNQFSAAVSMSGYYTAISDITTGNLYGSSSAYRDENSIDWRLTHLPAPPVSILVTSSAIGERTLPGTMEFLHLIRPPMRGYSLIMRQGGHNYYTWRRELPQSLEWLSNRLTPARPQAGSHRRGTPQPAARSA